jgi:hypothetical protein
MPPIYLSTKTHRLFSYHQLSHIRLYFLPSFIVLSLFLSSQAVGPGATSLRLPHSCACLGSHRRARTHQQPVQTVHTNDMDTEGDGGTLCAELGQSDSWYEGSVSSINVIFSPPKPVVKSTTGVKIEVDNESGVNRRYEAADNDGGKGYFPLVSSITLVSESDPRSLLSSSDLSSGSQNQGNVFDINVSIYSSKISSTSREESLELSSFIDMKHQIGELDNQLVQRNNNKLSRTITVKIEENKICDKIPAVIVRRINHLRIGKNNLGKKVMEILNENTVSRKNRIDILGSRIFNSNNFLRPVCHRPSMQATAHMTQLSDKVLEKTLHLINQEVVC